MSASLNVARYRYGLPGAHSCGSVITTPADGVQVAPGRIVALPKVTLEVPYRPVRLTVSVLLVRFRIVACSWIVAAHVGQVREVRICTLSISEPSTGRM